MASVDVSAVDGERQKQLTVSEVGSGRYAYASHFSLVLVLEKDDTVLVGASCIALGLKEFSSNSGRFFSQQNCVGAGMASIQSTR